MFVVNYVSFLANICETSMLSIINQPTLLTITFEKVTKLLYKIKDVKIDLKHNNTLKGWRQNVELLSKKTTKCRDYLSNISNNINRYPKALELCPL